MSFIMVTLLIDFTGFGEGLLILSGFLSTGNLESVSSLIAEFILMSESNLIVEGL